MPRTSSGRKGLRWVQRWAYAGLRGAHVASGQCCEHESQLGDPAHRTRPKVRNPNRIDPGNFFPIPEVYRAGNGKDFEIPDLAGPDGGNRDSRNPDLAGIGIIRPDAGASGISGPGAPTPIIAVACAMCRSEQDTNRHSHHGDQAKCPGNDQEPRGHAREKSLPPTGARGRMPVDSEREYH